jgi:hypothetical protein
MLRLAMALVTRIRRAQQPSRSLIIQVEYGTLSSKFVLRRVLY